MSENTQWPGNMGDGDGQKEAWTVQTFWAGLTDVKKFWLVTGSAAVLLLIIIIAACSGSGSSASPYAQGQAWESGQEQAGNVVAMQLDRQALYSWCSANQPADMPGDWTDGCMASYDSHDSNHPN